MICSFFSQILKSITISQQGKICCSIYIVAQNNKQHINGILESQRILSFQGLECVIEDLARPITSANKCQNAEKPIFMLDFLLVCPSL